MSTAKSLELLEQQRVHITNQIAALGDLRAGSIISTSGRCGKANCHCHLTKDPGNGPNLRLTYKVEECLSYVGTEGGTSKIAIHL